MSDVKNGHGGYLEIINTGTPIVVTKTNVADNKLSTSYVLSVKEFQEQGRYFTIWYIRVAIP